MAGVSELCIKLADEVRQRNRILESVPGSGYHDNDRDAHNRLCAPHRRHLPGGSDEGSPPLPRISDNLVGFIDYRGRCVRFFGADAIAVYDALTEYLAELRTRPRSTYTGTERKLDEEIPEVILNTAVPSVSLWMDTWNDFLFVFDTQRVGISCLDFKGVTNGVDQK